MDDFEAKYLNNNTNQENEDYDSYSHENQNTQNIQKPTNNNLYFTLNNDDFDAQQILHFHGG